MGLLWARALGLRFGPALTGPPTSFLAPRPSSSVASSSSTLGANPARRGAPLSSTQRVPALCGAAQRRGAALHPRDALPPPLSTYATPSRPPARRGAPPSPTQPRRLHGHTTLLRDALARPVRRGAARAPPTRRSPALRGAALHLHNSAPTRAHDSLHLCCSVTLSELFLSPRGVASACTGL